MTTTLDSLQTISTAYYGDLTGLRIRSDKPVSVSFGVSATKMDQGAGYDHMWVQLPRLDMWGKEYVTFPTPAMNYKPGTTDVYYFAAAEDNTTVGSWWW